MILPLCDVMSCMCVPCFSSAIQEETEGAPGQDSSFLSQESMARTGSDRSKGRGEFHPNCVLVPTIGDSSNISISFTGVAGLNISHIYIYIYISYRL